LHELIAAAITENWTIMRKHNQRMAGILEQIIASGMAAGEFHPGDAALAARLVNTACIRFCRPRLMVENEQEPEPVLDQMVDFASPRSCRTPIPPSDLMLAPLSEGKHSLHIGRFPEDDRYFCRRQCRRQALDGVSAPRFQPAKARVTRLPK
jgi:hypothetical protein